MSTISHTHTRPAQPNPKHPRGTPADIAAKMARANPSFGNPVRAVGKCWDASIRLGWAMAERGHPGAYLIWALFGARSAGNHYGLLHEEIVYDLTARQFDPHAPFPLVLNRGEWESLQQARFVGPFTIHAEPV